MVTQKRSSAARKTQVLSVARTLFAEKGYSSTTLDDIADKVGVSRPRIVQLFGSKKSIYEAIARQAYREHPMDRDLEAPMAQKDDLGVFQAFAYHVLHHTQKREDREIFKILMTARLKEDEFHRVHFHHKDSLMISRLKDYVEDGIRDGRFRDLDARVVIYGYQAMISNLAIYRNVMKKMDFISVEDLSHACAEIFVSGIRDGS